jgi:hypothetical protein
MKLKGYESDITQFLRKLHQEKPNLPEERIEARAMWWDRPQDLDEKKRRAEAKVAQPGYVYYTPPRPDSSS